MLTGDPLVRRAYHLNGKTSAYLTDYSKFKRKKSLKDDIFTASVDSEVNFYDNDMDSVFSSAPSYQGEQLGGSSK